MKKTISIGLIVLLGFSIIVTKTSCYKKEQDCEVCKIRKTDFNNKLIFKTESAKIELDGTEGYLNIDKSSNLLSFNTVNSAVYKNVNTQLNSLLGLTDEAGLLVVYLNKPVNENGEFTKSNIDGVSRFTVVGDIITHNLYKRINNLFTNIDDMNCVVRGLTTNSMDYILEKIVYPGRQSNTVLVLSNKGHFPPVKKNSGDVLLRKAKYYFEVLQSQSISPSVVAPPSESFCGAPCVYSKSGTCYVDSIQRYCGAEPCRVILNLDKILKEHLMNADSARSAYDTTLQYSVKNRIAASAFGRKYINYYYDLSEVFTDHPASLGLLLQTTVTLYKFNSNLRKLVNPSGHESDVFLTSSMKTEIAGLIAQYQTLFADAYTTSVNSDILADMSWAENKTVSQILTRF